ncbi:zinc finger protein 704 isoform X2 [Pteronotus mesoamericanus]|uniref:zinc finger protein 704 isoform X2 n=1 Tax=Pteronotus mesoamericanus TaxID=1884717 RepID=UPI0023EAFE83|nr:zinc finger protein 704 isoform X2 [Pteronotus parnellii mesoamericanus]
MQARRLAKRSSQGGRRGSPALHPPGTAPESGRPPLPPPPPRSTGTGPPRASGAAASPVLLLLGEEDEDEEGVSRRRRGLGRVREKPRGGAEEDDDDDEEDDEEGVIEVVDGDGDDDEEYGEERFLPLGPGRAVPRGPARGALKVGSIKREMTFTFQPEDLKRDSSKKMSHQPLFPLEEDMKTVDTKTVNRALDHDKENTRSICLLEQKRKVVSSNIDVPPARKSSEELDMDKVTAAMVLTSLSTSPLVRSPPVRPNEGLSGSWKEGGAPSSSCGSGYWSWSAPSDQSNPSTPSPPLSADSAKPFRSPAPDDGIDEAEAGNLLFDEPIPRKRKNSMKVVFKCLWKNCGKVLSTAAGIQKHIRTIHLGRVGDSDYSDGEEDFYYTEIKLNTDSMADGLGSLALASPSQSLASPPTFPIPDSSRTETPCAKTETKLMTPLSRSAPTTLYLVHTDHAYQATPPVTIPGSAKFAPNGSSFSISWQSPPVTFTGIPVSPTHHHPGGTGEQRQHSHTVLSSPPRGMVSLRKPRGEGKKCRKVYGMENRDLWCTACRWKKACQRFLD